MRFSNQAVNLEFKQNLKLLRLYSAWNSNMYSNVSIEHFGSLHYKFEVEKFFNARKRHHSQYEKVFFNNHNKSGLHIFYV